MARTSSRSRRVVVAGGLVLLLALAALAAAAWALSEAERRDTRDRAERDAGRIAELTLERLAEADDGREGAWARLAADLTAIDPPRSRGFDAMPAPLDAAAAWLVRQAETGEGPLPLEDPVAALDLVFRVDDPVSRVRAAVVLAQRAIREGRDASGLRERARVPERLRGTRDAVFLGLLAGDDSARRRALAAVGSDDENEALALLVGVVGDTAADAIATRRAELEGVRQLVGPLAGAPELTSAGGGRARVVLDETGAAFVARTERPSGVPADEQLDAQTHWFATRLALERVTYVARRAHPDGLAPVRVPADDQVSAPLPGAGAWRITTRPTPAGSSNLVLLFGLALAAAAAIAAYVTFARGVIREARLAQLRTEFVATVGHELRTPVAVVRTCAETLLLGRATEPADRRRLLEGIVRESERLSGLLGNVLDFARLEAGRRRFELSRADLGDVVRQTVETYQGALERVGFSVSLEVEVDLPPVDCDREAVSAAVTNLLENAAKYSPDSRAAEVDVRRDGAAVIVEVVDHGSGIPDDEKPRVFERFFRGRGRAVQETRGTGIGLALVRHAADAHDARIEVVDTPGGGATFRLVFPSRGTGEEDATS